MTLYKQDTLSTTSGEAHDLCSIAESYSNDDADAALQVSVKAWHAVGCKLTALFHQLGEEDEAR